MHPQKPKRKTLHRINRDRLDCERILRRVFGAAVLVQFIRNRHAAYDGRTGRDMLTNSPRALLMRLVRIDGNGGIA